MPSHATDSIRMEVTVYDCERGQWPLAIWAVVRCLSDCGLCFHTCTKVTPGRLFVLLQ